MLVESIPPPRLHKHGWIAYINRVDVKPGTYSVLLIPPNRGCALAPKYFKDIRLCRMYAEFAFHILHLITEQKRINGYNEDFCLALLDASDMSGVISAWNDFNLEFGDEGDYDFD